MWMPQTHHHTPNTSADQVHPLMAMAFLMTLVSQKGKFPRFQPDLAFVGHMESPIPKDPLPASCWYCRNPQRCCVHTLMGHSFFLTAQGRPPQYKAGGFNVTADRLVQRDIQCWAVTHYLVTIRNEIPFFINECIRRRAYPQIKEDKTPLTKSFMESWYEFCGCAFSG